MKIIEVIESESTGLMSGFSNVSLIEIDTTTQPKSGGFGEVYKVLSINGNNLKAKQIVKILKNEHIDESFITIQKLQKALLKVNNTLLKTGDTLIDTYPGLMAVPQISFKGYLDGEEIKGYLANDLSELNYVEYKEAILEGNLNVTFQHLELQKKYKICYDIVNAMHLLSSLKYMHADIKEDAVFIDVDNNRAAIIDYDGGAIYDTKTRSYNTATKGTKANNWLAPEIIEVVFSKKSLEKYELQDTSDIWSITIAMYYFILSNDPFSFLLDKAKITIANYLKTYNWPQIPLKEPYLNKEGAEVFKISTEYYLHKLPPKLKTIFTETFNNGYFNVDARLSYKNLKEALQSTSKAPQITAFTADNYELTKLEEVTLMWKVQAASKIYIDNINVGNAKRFKVKPNRDTVYTLKVCDAFDNFSEKEITIKVSKKPPEIHDFSSNKTTRESNAPILLSWNISNAFKIVLQPNGTDITKLKALEVFPVKNTIYTLEAYSCFGAKAIKKIEVKTSKQPPEIIRFESDVSMALKQPTVTLKWEVNKADNIILQPGNYNVTGHNSKDVEVFRDTVFTLEAESLFGVTVEKKINIAVSKIPADILSFTASSSMRTDESLIELRWDVKNAEKVQLFPEGIEIPLTGSKWVDPRLDTVYKIVATTLFGVESQESIKILVSKKPPVINALQITPSLREHENRSLQISWETENAEKVELFPSGEIVPESGTIEVEPSRETIYTLKATTMFGVVTEQKVLARVSNKAPRIKQFKFNSPIVQEGEESILSWCVEDAKIIRLQELDKKELITESEGTKTITAEILKKSKYKGCNKYKIIAETYFGVIAEKEITQWVLNTSQLIEN